MGDLSLPSLTPRVVDSLWFNVDKPSDDHEELSKLEDEHQSWVTTVMDKLQGQLVPFICNGILSVMEFGKPIACTALHGVTETAVAKTLELLSDKDNSMAPIGKTAGPSVDDDEQEEDDVDDGSESDADELDTDMIDERDSVDDAEVDMNAAGTTSPQWVLR